MRKRGYLSSAVYLLVLLLATSACSSAVNGTGFAVKASTSTVPRPPLQYPRSVASTEFGDPPDTDVCATLGSTFFTSAGYNAAVPSGQRAASCEYYLNSGVASALQKPEVYVDVYVDERDSGVAPSTTIDGYGLDILKPTTTNNTCSEDLYGDSIDVVIDAGPGTKSPSSTTLCALAHAAVVRTVEVFKGTVPLVKRHLSPDSLTTQNLCDATAATASFPSFGGQSFQLGFGTACRDRATTYDWWVELRFGILPTDGRSTVQFIAGHGFQTHLVPSDGYCRYRWQGPVVPGGNVNEEITVLRQARTDAGNGASCTPVGVFAGQLISALKRH